MSSIWSRQKHLYVVFFLFFLQFIILNIYYFDDLFRIQHGYYGWKGDGRILGDWLYKLLLQFRNPIADIYPLPLLIVGLFFCYSVYAFLNTVEITSKFKQSLLLLIIIGSPLALSNWLFKFDGAFMLASVGFAILPFSLQKLNCKKSIVLSVLSLVAVFCTYQISINIYIGFVPVYLFWRATKGDRVKPLLFSLMTFFLIFVASYLIYSQLILKIFPTHSYAANFREVSTLSTICTQILDNAHRIYNYLKPFFKSGLGYSLLLAIIFNIYVLVRKKKGVLVFILWVIALLGCLFAMGGVMFFTKNPPLYARTFLGLIPLLCFPFIVLAIFRVRILFFISAIIMVLMLLIVDRAALNAVSAEAKLHDNISTQILTELSLNKVDNFDEILIYGSPEKANVTKTNIKTFPVIEQVIQRTFSDGYDAGRFILMFNGLHYVVYANNRDAIKMKLPDSIPIASNSIYDLFYIDGIVVINFDK